MSINDTSSHSSLVLSDLMWKITESNHTMGSCISL